MNLEEAYDPNLGRRLAVCRPHPGVLFLFAVPGLVTAFWLVSGVKIALEAGTLSQSMTMVWILALAAAGLFTPVILRARDRAEIFQRGFRFNGREYLIAQCGDIAVQHRGSAYIRLLDKTVVTFQYQGEPVRLATRTLRDFSAQLRRHYGGGGV